MELRHLRYFVAIAEERSFTRAAERLWVAQPGLSTQMRRLEAELGTKLFERRPRGIELTSAGELFLERARIALTAAEAAGVTGRDLTAGVIGRVRLGIASGPSSGVASDLLWRFSRERPGVELTVLEAHGGTLWRELREGRLDALIAPAGHGSADLRALELGTEMWVALIGTGHRLAGVGSMPAEHLEGERIAISGHRDGAAYDRAVRDLLIDLGVAAELVPGAPGPALNRAVAAGEIVALTARPDALPSGVLARTLAPSRRLVFELVWREEAPSPALAAFASTAAAIAKRRPASRSLAAVA